MPAIISHWGSAHWRPVLVYRRVHPRTHTHRDTPPVVHPQLQLSFERSRSSRMSQTQRGRISFVPIFGNWLSRVPLVAFCPMTTCVLIQPGGEGGGSGFFLKQVKSGDDQATFVKCVCMCGFVAGAYLSRRAPPWAPSMWCFTYVASVLCLC